MLIPNPVLGDRRAVAPRSAVPQFNKKTEETLGIQKGPSCARSNPCSVLQNANTRSRQCADRCLDVVDFKRM
jgi:hypothetical protein